MGAPSPADTARHGRPPPVVPSGPLAVGPPVE